MSLAMPRLSDEDLVHMLDLLGDVDSVELKMTVPDAGQRSAIQTMGLDPIDAQIRQVFFYDTPDLRLNASGVVARSRRIQGKGGDSVIKLRPVVPKDLPTEVRTSDNCVVEVDVIPGGYVTSASLKGTVGIDHPRLVSFGERPIRKLFSKEQRAFFAQNAPEGLGLDDLSVLGPIFVLKVKGRGPLGGRVVAEVWLYPDGSRILELSTRCRPDEAFEMAARARVYLSGLGIELGGEQQTKTAAALKFFSRELSGKSKGASPAGQPAGEEAPSAG